MQSEKPFKYGAVLIAGPTASGKSAAALALAESLNGTIINADSMQVYGELRVLTARPSRDDESRACHRLYGIASARERYSSGRYQSDAALALAEAQAQQRLPIFTGGTGLYFDVLEKGLSPMPDVPADIREQVRRRYDTMGRDAFLARLIASDPASARLHPSDTQRLLRAADILEATGKPLSHWQQQQGKPVLDGIALARFVLAPPRDLLVTRISSRVDSMFAGGALDEARALVGLDAALPAAKVLGLPQAWAHLANEIDLETACEQTKLATRQYAKRQMTWFRQRMADWAWLDATDLGNIVSQLKESVS